MGESMNSEPEQYLRAQFDVHLELGGYKDFVVIGDILKSALNYSRFFEFVGQDHGRTNQFIESFGQVSSMGLSEYTVWGSMNEMLVMQAGGQLAWLLSTAVSLGE